MARILFGMRRECGSDCEVTECVFVRVFDLTSFLGPVVVSVTVSFPISPLSYCATQTLSLSEKRSASGTLMCYQTQMARMNVEGPMTMPKRRPFQSIS